MSAKPTTAIVAAAEVALAPAASSSLDKPAVVVVAAAMEEDDVAAPMEEDVDSSTVDELRLDTQSWHGWRLFYRSIQPELTSIATYANRTQRKFF